MRGNRAATIRFNSSAHIRFKEPVRQFVQVWAKLLHAETIVNGFTHEIPLAIGSTKLVKLITSRKAVSMLFSFESYLAI